MSLMSRRNNSGRQIRGPQSALTDFLAANNISAAQIQGEFLRRQQALHDAVQNDAVLAEDIETGDPPTGAGSLGEQSDVPATKKPKGSKSKYPDKKDCPRSTKSTPQLRPGQLEHCEICSKRFTVTSYSKTGPLGNLLCMLCSKNQKSASSLTQSQRAKSRNVKRRQVQSAVLDGRFQRGSASLQELCMKEAIRNVDDIDNLGALPMRVVETLSKIMSKQRTLTPTTLSLFLTVDSPAVRLHDCAKLEAGDFARLISAHPNMSSLVLRNASQFRDESLNALSQRSHLIQHLYLEAANLVSLRAWSNFFEHAGSTLQSLKLTWLDDNFTEDILTQISVKCICLERIKLHHCSALGSGALDILSRMTRLKFISLEFTQQTAPDYLERLIDTLGPRLETLSLRNFDCINDLILATIGRSCKSLKKMRLTGLELCSDDAFALLFKNTENTPLGLIDLSASRSLDQKLNDGTSPVWGMSSQGLISLLQHSGSEIVHLNLSSCRHITADCLTQSFDGSKLYPSLQVLDVSFISCITDEHLASFLRCCPKLQRLIVFGCLNIKNAFVPDGVLLVGSACGNG